MTSRSKAGSARGKYGGRWRRLTTTIVCVLVVIAAPTADILAFGIHDHLAASDDDDHEASRPDGLHHSSHHCDLEMNPASGSTADTLAPPRPLPNDVGDLSHAVVARPFAPFAPPRS
jgi:hypothetical protein